MKLYRNISLTMIIREDFNQVFQVVIFIYSQVLLPPIWQIHFQLQYRPLIQIHSIIYAFFLRIPLCLECKSFPISNQLLVLAAGV
ncbi:hypothetical protein FGO68_gene2509 [Halteria grandinella]|uniref:Uncharacterized protein n=1 Tax=Halteria grandinella TaxID=5974 RepID=A0A8J8NBY3_HALGN|nr:hypothetical protein FGO68_gene2509 [Halteria grandinella]